MTDLFGPLRERYAGWLALDAAGVAEDREEAAADVRALPLILRMERDRPPSWHAALRLATRAAALICLDPQAEPGGPWHQAVVAYLAGHIRKVTRRARGAHWRAVQELPGLTLIDGDTEVRVLVPSRVAELDPRVARLQVGGTDVGVDEAGPDPAGPHLEVLVPPEPVTTLGKAMAQAGHAGMIFAALAAADRLSDLEGWVRDGCPVAVHRVSISAWAEVRSALADPSSTWTDRGLLAVRDAGFTEVAPGTVTVAARWR